MGVCAVLVVQTTALDDRMFAPHPADIDAEGRGPVPGSGSSAPAG